MPKKKEEPHDVFFRKEGILYKKNISDIVYIENSRSGQIIHCTNGDLKMPYKPNKLLMNDLNSEKFVRCSRYIIINSDFIDRIDMVNRYIQLKDSDKQIEIGNAYKKKLMQDLSYYG